MQDCFGEMLSWHMLAAGVAPQSLDNRLERWLTKD